MPVKTQPLCKQVVCNWEGIRVPSWVCIAHFPTRRKNSTRNGVNMKPIKVISHIVCALALVNAIIVGFWGMNEYGVAPLWALLTAGGSFVLGTQLMLIMTGEDA